MHQPPGGPVSSAQSVALEPVGSCEDTLTLLSKPLQPHYSNDILMSYCACLLYVCVCVTAQICLNVVGQTVPRASFGRVRGGVGGCRSQQPCSMALWLGTAGFQSPPAEAVPPCRVNPLLLRINQLHSAGPYCAVKTLVHPPNLPQPPLSLPRPHPHYLVLVSQIFFFSFISF